MAERHPAEDVLLDLALGDVTEPDSEHLAQHLSSCAECRSHYDTVVSTIDHTLAAAPRVQPPPGFDLAVLESIELAPTSRTTGASPEADAVPDGQSSRRGTWRRRPVLVAAAAGLAGAVIGVAGSVGAGIFDDDPPASTATIPGAPLVTSAGDTIGSASYSYLDGRRVIVLAATGGQAGATYECRLLLADGEAVTVGEWPAPEEGATWVVPAPETPAVSVELVNESGTTWSKADL